MKKTSGESEQIWETIPCNKTGWVHFIFSLILVERQSGFHLIDEDGCICIHASSFVCDRGEWNSDPIVATRLEENDLFSVNGTGLCSLLYFVLAWEMDESFLQCWQAHDQSCSCEELYSSSNSACPCNGV